MRRSNPISVEGTALALAGMTYPDVLRLEGYESLENLLEALNRRSCPLGG